MAHIARKLMDRAFLHIRRPEPVRQVGALPYVVLEDRVVFLLVTSRRSGRWIVPKGSLIPGETPWRSAEIEALEEAGVEGEAEREPIGSYRTIKKGSVTRRVVEVDLYPLRVTRQHDQWLEMGKRHRHWVLLREAKRLMSDRDVAVLAAKLSRRLLSETQPESHKIVA